MGMVPRVTKKRLIVIIAVVIAAGLLVIAAVLLRNDEKASPVDNAINKADTATTQGNYDDALNTLKQAQSHAKTDEEKVAILNDLAAAAANAGQLEEALGYYAQKHKIDPESAKEDGLLVGELYERTDNTQKAIEAYRQYLEYLETQPGDEFTQAKIDSMNERLRTLEGSRQ